MDKPPEPALTLAAVLGRTTTGLSSLVEGSLALVAAPAAPLRGLRKLVSGSKQRFQRDGFDLDLTYVQPQLIALGLPASGLIEPLYRNPLSEVRMRACRPHDHFARIFSLRLFPARASYGGPVVRRVLIPTAVHRRDRNGSWLPSSRHTG